MVGIAFELINLADGDGGIGEVDEKLCSGLEQGSNTLLTDADELHDARPNGFRNGDMLSFDREHDGLSLVWDLVERFEQPEDVAAGFGEECLAVHHDLDLTADVVGTAFGLMQAEIILVQPITIAGAAIVLEGGTHKIEALGDNVAVFGQQFLDTFLPVSEEHVDCYPFFV